MARAFSSCLDQLAFSPTECVFTLEVMSLFACVWVDGGIGCCLHSFWGNVYSETAKERDRKVCVCVCVWSLTHV